MKESWQMHVQVCCANECGVVRHEDQTTNCIRIYLSLPLFLASAYNVKSSSFDIRILTVSLPFAQCEVWRTDHRYSSRV